MQPCRFCGRIIPVAKPYDPTEDWICSECAKEFDGHARRINEEDLQKAIQSSIDAYRGQDTGGVFIKADRKRWISEVTNLRMQDMREKRNDQG